MQIILLTDVENLGNANEVATVKDGYGRNFLIPRGMAVVANKTNLANLKELVRQHDARENKMLGTYQDLAAKATNVTLRITAKAGESGKLFGSVNASHIVDALASQAGVTIDRKKVTLNEDVKELGSYTATLKLHKEVQPIVNFEVVPENTLAEAAAE
ncbi:MAG: ribosomal protein l9p [Bacteroidota bacterium]|jgi:large subunit ribosomal protein L9